MGQYINLPLGEDIHFDHQLPKTVPSKAAATATKNKNRSPAKKLASQNRGRSGPKFIQPPILEINRDGDQSSQSSKPRSSASVTYQITHNQPTDIKPNQSTSIDLDSQVAPEPRDPNFNQPPILEIPRSADGLPTAAQPDLKTVSGEFRFGSAPIEVNNRQSQPAVVGRATQKPAAALDQSQARSAARLAETIDSVIDGPSTPVVVSSDDNTASSQTIVDITPKPAITIKPKRLPATAVFTPPKIKSPAKAKTKPSDTQKPSQILKLNRPSESLQPITPDQPPTPATVDRPKPVATSAPPAAASVLTAPVMTEPQKATDNNPQWRPPARPATTVGPPVVEDSPKPEPAPPDPAPTTVETSTPDSNSVHQTASSPAVATEAAVSDETITTGPETALPRRSLLKGLGRNIRLEPTIEISSYPADQTQSVYRQPPADFMPNIAKSTSFSNSQSLSSGLAPASATAADFGIYSYSEQVKKRHKFSRFTEKVIAFSFILGVVFSGWLIWPHLSGLLPFLGTDNQSHLRQVFNQSLAAESRHYEATVNIQDLLKNYIGENQSHLLTSTDLFYQEPDSGRSPQAWTNFRLSIDTPQATSRACDQQTSQLKSELVWGDSTCIQSQQLSAGEPGRSYWSFSQLTLNGNESEIPQEWTEVGPGPDRSLASSLTSSRLLEIASEVVDNYDPSFYSLLLPSGNITDQTIRKKALDYLFDRPEPIYKVFGCQSDGVKVLDCKINLRQAELYGFYEYLYTDLLKTDVPEIYGAIKDKTGYELLPRQLRIRINTKDYQIFSVDGNWSLPNTPGSKAVTITHKPSGTDQAPQIDENTESLLPLAEFQGLIEGFESQIKR